MVVRVAYSCVNYKDALAATGAGRIIRRFPCVGGIDLSGTVVESSDARFKKGDAVIATSYDIGVAHDGGYAEYARVPADWVVPMPKGMSLFEAMALGTAGFTAGLARGAHGARRPQAGQRAGRRDRRDRRRRARSRSTSSPGSGITSWRSPARSRRSAYLKGIGAKEVMLRSSLDLAKIKPLDKAMWAGAVDNLGGDVLAWLASTMQHRRAARRRSASPRA